MHKPAVRIEAPATAGWSVSHRPHGWRAPRQSLKQGLALSALVLLAACAQGPGHGPGHGHGPVQLLEPAEGATVSSPFKVRFGVTGMAVMPAGNMAEKTGHHHLLINLAPIAAKQVVPATAQHLHFGAGQTETMVTLPPGTYKLTAQFADGAHMSYGPGFSHSITVTVR